MYQYDDGGRGAAGRKGVTSDCVTRAVAIAAELPYDQVYDALAAGCAGERRTKRSYGISGRKSASNGINTNRKWFKDYMASLGFTWTPTMHVGQGCTVHLKVGELPPGRIVVSLSRHFAAVIDGVVHDLEDPSRDGTRCVYGYWSR
jgi:hypothetical protein